jgi:hypothetical protein
MKKCRFCGQKMAINCKKLGDIITYAEYRRIISSNKSLRRSIASLRQQFLNMSYYWDKRKASKKKIELLHQRIRSVEGLRNSLEILFKHRLLLRAHRHISKRGQKLYPLFISHRGRCRCPREDTKGHGWLCVLEQGR